MIVNIHIPKTAGTSTTLSLASALFYKNEPPKVLNCTNSQTYSIKDAAIVEFHPIYNISKEVYSNIQYNAFNSDDFFFCFFREPYQRMLSHCVQIANFTSKFYLQENYVFNSFCKLFNIEDISLKNLIYLIEKHINFIGIYEDYLKELNKLMILLNIYDYPIHYALPSKITDKNKYAKLISKNDFWTRNKLDYELYEYFSNK